MNRPLMQTSFDLRFGVVQSSDRTLPVRCARVTGIVDCKSSLKLTIQLQPNNWMEGERLSG